MAGKAPKEPTPEQQEQFYQALVQLDAAGSLTPEQQVQFDQATALRSGVDDPLNNPSQNIRPDTNGMGNDGGQRTPTNTGQTPANGLPGSGGPEWGQGGYTPPVSPTAGGGGGGAATPPGTGGNAGGGAAGGAGGGLPAGGNLYGPPMQFGGYEGPNADLYASQFGNAVAGQNAFQTNQLSNAIRREQQQSEQAGAEPWQADWSWADLPQVRTNAQQPGESQPYSWGLNSAYNLTPGESSNADMIRAVMGNSQFSDSDRNWFNRAMADSNMDNNYYWATRTDPQEILSKLGGYSGENRARVEKAINLAFTREDLATPEGGGPAAPPPGYAAPR